MCSGEDCPPLYRRATRKLDIRPSQDSLLLLHIVIFHAVVVLHVVAGLGNCRERHGQEAHNYQPAEHFFHVLSPEKIVNSTNALVVGQWGCTTLAKVTKGGEGL